jgi:hypothetical protein
MRLTCGLHAHLVDGQYASDELLCAVVCVVYSSTRHRRSFSRAELLGHSKKLPVHYMARCSVQSYVYHAELCVCLTGTLSIVRISLMHATHFVTSSNHVLQLEVFPTVILTAAKLAGWASATSVSCACSCSFVRDVGSS